MKSVSRSAYDAENPAAPPRRDLIHGLILGTAAFFCLLYASAQLYLLDGRLGFPLDDSWIHLQFARQIAAGEGLSFNPGAMIPGVTAPLWTCLLSLGFLLPGSALAWSQLLGVGFYLGTVDASTRLARELGLDRLLCRLAAALVAATPWLLWSALSGMEVTLFAWLTLWGMILHLREQPQARPVPASLAVFALSGLARPEGYLLFALALLSELSHRPPRWRRLGTGALLGALLLGPTLLFYRATSGSMLPTTFAVKGSSAMDLLPSGRYLRTTLGIFFESQPLMTLLAGAGLLVLLERRVTGGGRRAAGLLIGAWPLALPLAYSLMASDRGPAVVGNFGRYYFPLLPMVVVLGLLGLERAYRTLRAHPWRRQALAALVLLLLAPQIPGLIAGSRRYAQTVANVEDSDVAAARWLRSRGLPASALLAVQDIGALKYLLPNPVLDLAGIVNPEILPSLRGTPGDTRYWEERLLEFLESRRPEYLVVFPSSYPMLTGRAPGFQKLKGFPVSNNVTMAGDELAVFSTPWTRSSLGSSTPGAP